METFTKQDKVDLFRRSSFLHGLPFELLSELAEITELVTFEKGAVISRIGEISHDVFLVVSGLMKVSVCSSTGKRITFLLVKEGEPYNIMGPHMPAPRLLEAEALQAMTCLRIGGGAYLAFLEKQPQIVHNIIRWIGVSFDSAYSRILDLMEKKVDLRIMRVLSSLHQKFGSPLMFTSVELSEIAGTTPESTLRAMGQLRALGLIETGRGKIWVKDEKAMIDDEFGKMIL